MWYIIYFILIMGNPSTAEPVLHLQSTQPVYKSLEDCESHALTFKNDFGVWVEEEGYEGFVVTRCNVIKGFDNI
jgi:hypothetical protein